MAGFQLQFAVALPILWLPKFCDLALYIGFTLGIGSALTVPIAAAGRIYVTDLEGITVVVSSGDVPRPLAVNSLSESVSASAAIAGCHLFLRGEKHLYCLAEVKE